VPSGVGRPTGDLGEAGAEGDEVRSTADGEPTEGFGGEGGELMKQARGDDALLPLSSPRPPGTCLRWGLGGHGVAGGDERERTE
jgi:hypothetical protein